MNNIAIFASGSGTNAECIIRHFTESPSARVSLILSNKSNAYVLTRATSLGIPSAIFSSEDLYRNSQTSNTHIDISSLNSYNNNPVIDLLKEYNIDLIVLAGFLLKIPKNILDRYAGRIINIHPALLPKYGGKGMYGDNVHRAVIKSGDTESGITIHLVDEVYDNGKILFQATCSVLPNDTIDTLATRIHELEHKYFPQVIEDYLKEL